MGVGAGFGVASEAEACWPGAVPPLETKTKLINKTIRITGCMDRSFNGQYRVPKNPGFRYILRWSPKHALFMAEFVAEAISKCTIHKRLLVLGP